MQISEISNLETRNIIRGLSANKDNPVKVRTIRHALRVCPLKDLGQLTQYLIQHNFYELYFKSLRPKTNYELFWRRGQPITIDRAKEIIRAVIYENASDALAISQFVDHISEKLLSKDYKNVVDELTKLEIAYGKSKFSLRVISYLMSLQDRLSLEEIDQFPLSQLREVCDDLFNEDTPVKMTIFFNHLLDAFDVEIDPMQSIIETFKAIPNISQNEAERKIYFTLFCSALFPSIDLEFGEDSTTSEICFSSITDMVVHFRATSGAKELSQCIDRDDHGKTRVDRRCETTLRPFDILDKRFEDGIVQAKYEALDIAAYRLSNVLFPCDGINGWKSAIDRKILSRCQDFASIIKSIKYSDIYSKDLKLKHLSEAPTGVRIALRDYDNNSGGIFSRTFAALELMDRGQRLTDMKAEEIRLLLN